MENFKGKFKMKMKGIGNGKEKKNSKKKFGQFSKSLKTLWQSLTAKLTFVIYVIINGFNSYILPGI